MTEPGTALVPVTEPGTGSGTGTGFHCDSGTGSGAKFRSDPSHDLYNCLLG